MARIKIEDLPKDMKISKKDMRKITGGALIGDFQYLDAELSNISLQDAMNKQAESMQLMSNIQKSQHDTLKAIINNMR